jgi:hypothetical protein
MPRKAAGAQEVAIPGIAIEEFEMTLEGDSPLLCHAWSEKAKRMILEKQMKVPTQGREAKDPEQDFLQTLYPYEGKAKGAEYGFPAIAFKSAAVDACRFVNMKMTEARGAFHIPVRLVPIFGKPVPQEDMVRVGMGTADIRYRAAFDPWHTTFTVRYNKNAMSIEQIVNLFNTGGFGVGVGEWRPERNGSNGMFHVQ